jgi:hypothetical protein
MPFFKIIVDEDNDTDLVVHTQLIQSTSPHYPQDLQPPLKNVKNTGHLINDGSEHPDSQSPRINHFHEVVTNVSGDEVNGVVGPADSNVNSQTNYQVHTTFFPTKITPIEKNTKNNSRHDDLQNTKKRSLNDCIEDNLKQLKQLTTLPNSMRIV